MNRIVTRDEWLVARKRHLRREKDLTRLRDELSAERRELPWVRVEKEYVFESPGGKQTLAELFDGHSQLIVYHFMLGPGKEGCVGCSFAADHFAGPLLHLPQRDVTLVAVSRAPLAELESFRRRMGWSFPWVSSHGSDFNYDYHVSFTREQIEKGETEYNFRRSEVGIEDLHGLSVFVKDAAGEVFHSYSSYARGAEVLLGTYALLDLVPKGRDEKGPAGNLTDWVRHHDRYREPRG